MYDLAQRVHTGHRSARHRSSDTSWPAIEAQGLGELAPDRVTGLSERRSRGTKFRHRRQGALRDEAAHSGPLR